MTENRNDTGNGPSAGSPTGSARDEAQRLVAAALAAASVAARGITRNISPLSGVADTAQRLLAGGTDGHVATGSPECCVCPLCRAIAAVRDPSPETAVKLAIGASDLASGLTGVLRSMGDLLGRPPAGGTRPAPADRPRTAPDPAATWRAATAQPATAQPAADRPAPVSPDDRATDRTEPDDPWHAATTAPAQAPPVVAPAPVGEPAPPEGD